MKLLAMGSKAKGRGKASEAPALPDNHQVAEAAYYLAEKRGFAPGHEDSDWYEAERQLAGDPLPDPVVAPAKRGSRR